MANKADKVRLTVSASATFNINLTLAGKTFHVQTEHGDRKSPNITTHIYHKGEIVFSKKSDYSNILKAENLDNLLREKMLKQHQSAVDEFTKKFEDNRKKVDYFDAVKKLVKTGNNRQALKILQQGLEEFPDDPFILSYYGCLSAVVEKKYDEGIKICQKALKKIGSVALPGEEPLYASFYLNLGRAYLAGNNKQSAVDSFNSGLRFDKKNSDLLWELKKLGVRRKPVIPFLGRDNPINKYLGKMFSSMKGK